MTFTRDIQGSYPNVYDTWSTEDSSWIIQDLAPEDDAVALEILIENLCPDETLCQLQHLVEHPESVHSMREYWREVLKQRVGLGCYEVKNGVKTLVALNVCVVSRAGEENEVEIKGEKWKNVYDALHYAETKTDAHKYLGLDVILFAMGLVVKREYRGAKLGKRILAAREPLSKLLGIKGTATVFTGIASQKLAASCGFETIADISITELADAGLPYPRNDERHIKYMVKKFA